MAIAVDLYYFELKEIIWATPIYVLHKTGWLDQGNINQPQWPFLVNFLDIEKCSTMVLNSLVKIFGLKLKVAILLNLKYCSIWSAGKSVVNL